MIKDVEMGILSWITGLALNVMTYVFLRVDLTTYRKIKDNVTIKVEIRAM
jgi:hypothetical protein